MKNRRKTGFDIDDAIILHILQRFVRHALERFLRLHDTRRMLEALQVQRQAAPVGVRPKPFGEVRGVVRRQVRVSGIAREIDDGLRTQPTIEMFMK